MTILNTLISNFKRVSASLSDSRRSSPNLRYSMSDIALGAFAVFFTQSPSFLSHQESLKRAHKTSNAESLFQIDQIPTDNQTRKILDTVPPEDFFCLFRDGFEMLEKQDVFNDFKVLDDRILIALDGTQSISSYNIHCENCSHKKFKNGETLYSHSFLGASVCSPNLNFVLSLEPEFIVPQDGHEKQDCERAASKRWLEKNGAYYGGKSAILLGDDIYACEPVCQQVVDCGLDFIFVCKSDSHKTLYNFIDGSEAEVVVIKGKKGVITTYRYFNDIPLNGSEKFKVNWVHVEEVDKSGAVNYKNAFVTNLLITKENVSEIALAGRTRWKIENETFNTLKRKGYNLEHNYGHGKQYLANVLIVFNLLAFSFHTLAQLIDEKYKKINDLIGSRRGFFEEIRVLTIHMIFKSWDNLWDTILDSFQPPGSSVPKKA